MKFEVFGCYCTCKFNPLLASFIQLESVDFMLYCVPESRVPEWRCNECTFVKQQNNLINDLYRGVAKGKGATDKQTFVE